MTLLVFTDLDGSLMEHESYSIAPAEPALEALAGRDSLLIFNSSKTAAEIRALQEQLSFTAPYVCENGAALEFPASDSDQQNQYFGLPRQDWLPEVHALREKTDYNFEGFADWSDARVSELTGLGKAEASLARQRQYSEPILWRGPASARRQFEADLARLGLSLLEGGRFFSIQGQHDKSKAMRWMQKQCTNAETLTVALGDSPNDSAMLAAADIAVIIKSAKSDQIQIQGPRKIIRTKRPGPAGWKDAMMDILQFVDSSVENKHG